MWPASYRDPSLCPPRLALELQVLMATAGFFVGSEDLNSGPYAGVASNSPPHLDTVLKSKIILLSYDLVK